MKSFVYAGLVFMLAGAGALFVCRQTINELSGVGVASGPPPAYSPGSPEFWDHELDYYWWVRPFLPQRYDVTRTLEFMEGEKDVGKLKEEFYFRIISSSRRLAAAEKVSATMILLGFVLLVSGLWRSAEASS